MIKCMYIVSQSAMEKTLFILFIIFSLGLTQKPIPNYIKTCRRNNPNLNECFSKNANLAMSYIAKGDPEYKIKTLLPYTWNHIIELQIPGLKFSMFDISVYGTENMTIVDPNIDFDKNLIQFYFTNPLIIWEGDYNATVEENGETKQKNGHVEFHFSDGKFLMSFKYKLQNRHGLEYAKIVQSEEEAIASTCEIKTSDADTNGLNDTEWVIVKNNLLNEETLGACAEGVADFFRDIFDFVPFHEVFPK